MNLKDNSQMQGLASLVTVRNHLAYLLNTGSRSLISKEDVRKIQNLLADLDKEFISSVLEEAPAAPPKEKNGFIKYGDSVAINNGAVVIAHPEPIEADKEAPVTPQDDKQMSLDFSKDINANKKKNNKKVFKRSDD